MRKNGWRCRLNMKKARQIRKLLPLRVQGMTGEQFAKNIGQRYRSSWPYTFGAKACSFAA
jgi:hypothetical protein